ncbi:DUF4397 domain-containing protein [Hymenobacter sp. DG01]|uniref:DUF4397 domain-containing protein n=1 Tax=Hymenobacter sp. DG01 TaxID=2584940 RepID=UPI0015DF50D5|nr:DUF4397 domain-containing protein [Hymenobacter sp. DG01]
MKTLTSFLRPAVLLAALPAALTFTACSDDDDNTNTPKPDQGRVMVVHAAAATNVRVKAFIKNNEVGQLDYGQASPYVATNVDTTTVSVNVASTNIKAARTVVKVEKDQSYSVFAYSPTATIGSISLLTTADDLTAPAANQAKVRLVHLAVGAPTPVRLSVPSPIPGGAVTDLTPDVAFGAASGFVAVNAGSPTLTITSTATPRTQVLAVGDGSGSGTGAKAFEAGKIYTIVVRGIVGAGVPANQQAQAVIIQNN